MDVLRGRDWKCFGIWLKESWKGDVYRYVVSIGMVLQLVWKAVACVLLHTCACVMRGRAYPFVRRGECARRVCARARKQLIHARERCVK